MRLAGTENMKSEICNLQSIVNKRPALKSIIYLKLLERYGTSIFPDRFTEFQPLVIRIELNTYCKINNVSYGYIGVNIFKMIQYFDLN